MAGKGTPSFGDVSHSRLWTTMNRTRFSRMASRRSRSLGVTGAWQSRFRICSKKNPS
jgi:hypothetical protein